MCCVFIRFNYWHTYINEFFCGEVAELGLNYYLQFNAA